MGGVEIDLHAFLTLVLGGGGVQLFITEAKNLDRP
jgi:hypothetical protein